MTDGQREHARAGIGRFAARKPVRSACWPPQSEAPLAHSRNRCWSKARQHRKMGCAGQPKALVMIAANALMSGFITWFTM